jgi:ABC-2 type transport system ATP-binding protein
VLADIARDSVKIRRRIGYLAQEPHYYEHLTARETLRFTARFFYSGPTAAIEDRIRNTLELAGRLIKPTADQGLRRRAARLGTQAQVNYPDLLILDEPAASLDPMGRHDVLEVMERLRKHTTVFYSTHILDDVQRVSDTVAILNHGELVAQAPIEELLAGSGGVAYSIVTRGALIGTEARVSSQPWVSNVKVTPNEDGYSHWLVSVTDAEAAETQLARLIMCEEQVVLTEFGRKKHELEEVFMNIVEGSNHGR